MTTVHQAIGAVIREMGGVGKNQRNKEQGYNFRGIDDVLKVLHPLLGEHGVFICPDVIEREYEERVSAKGTVGHCCHLHVRFTIYGPEGDSVQLSTWGEGLDYGDKSTNKAATAAYKYALFELFAISDPADDADHETPPEGRTTRRSAPSRPIPADPETGEVMDKAATDKQIGLIKRLFKELGTPPDQVKDVVDGVVNRSTNGWGDLSAAEASQVIDALMPPKKDETWKPTGNEDPF